MFSIFKHNKKLKFTIVRSFNDIYFTSVKHLLLVVKGCMKKVHRAVLLWWRIEIHYTCKQRWFSSLIAILIKVFDHISVHVVFWVDLFLIWISLNSLKPFFLYVATANDFLRSFNCHISRLLFLLIQLFFCNLNFFSSN